MPQAEWVERLKNPGPQRDAALAELRAILLRGLSRSLAERGGGEAFAEDIAQEALLRILSSLDSFEGRSRFTTWAMAIATRAAISELRRRHFQDVSLDQLTGDRATPFELASEGAEEVGPDDKKLVLETLRKLIDESLTPKQRNVMQAALTGMPVEEIARRTESNRNAVYKLFHDARQKLKQGFESSGITSDEIMATIG